jgi:hypothetical protein
VTDSANRDASAPSTIVPRSAVPLQVPLYRRLRLGNPSRHSASTRETASGELTSLAEVGEHSTGDDCGGCESAAHRQAGG